jgi:hypothetical protein
MSRYPEDARQSFLAEGTDYRARKDQHNSVADKDSGSVYLRSERGGSPPGFVESDFA